MAKKKKKEKKIEQDLVINLMYTQYPIMEAVADDCGMIAEFEDEEADWDIWFIDTAVTPSLLARMKPY